MKNILIVQGHPDGRGDHLCHALAKKYHEAATKNEHQVELIDLGILDIPFIRSSDDWINGTRANFVLDAQKAIKKADHIVFIYPLWLGSMPAVLKAWLEQVLREDFAFEKSGRLPQKLLKNKSARIIVTMGMPSIAYRWFFFAHSLRSFDRNILKFCGIKPVRWSIFGSAEDPKGKAQKAHLAKAAQDGAAAR